MASPHWDRKDVHFEENFGGNSFTGTCQTGEIFLN